MIEVRKASMGLAVGALAFLLLGCPSKKPKPDEFGGPQAGSGPNSGDLGGGSLERFKQGLEPGAGGPLADVHFDYDSYELRQDARSTLQTNANWLKENSEKRVEIEGHCDERGTVEYNLALGAKRAKAAKDYLATLGIGAERLSTISYGEELPTCREQTEDCFLQNRRAHFVVLQ
ncbi:MAG: peptidoglycan-associated lipoprotein [Candidatus Binatota bacterium]|jgi:peptidoglycan-associated lipoprotein|nr:peptidoglycan-associated lipoprotein [Candidatus Binatota bacterium]